MVANAVKNYLKTSGTNAVNLKAVLFDMDGVLFDSMPNHAESWVRTMKQLGIDFSPEEAYMNEGRTGTGTINLAFQRVFGRNVSEEEAREIYQIKSDHFNNCPKAKVMPGVIDVLEKVKAAGLQLMIVTGTGQKSLLESVDAGFPGIFDTNLMITANDVVHGKPNPEPYLKALQKGGYKPEETIVVENAPLGVQSAHAAGIFTIAVNTGPLPDEILQNAGADIIFADMHSFSDRWEELLSALNDTKS